MTNPSINQLKEALAIKEQIERLECRLKSILESSAAPAAASLVKRGPRKMSAAARARIAAAQKARWAKVKGKTTAPVAKAAEKPAPKKKGKLSAEGRAKIVAALKARWAARRAKQNRSKSTDNALLP